MKTRNGNASLLLFAALLGGCGGPFLPLQRQNETLWATRSAEFIAVALQTYGAAGEKIEEALADPGWTACLEQAGDFGSLPPAIILDLDETVLDNRPFQERLLRERRDFDEESWNEWVNSTQVEAIPGATAFILRAESSGVEVFYVTNREPEVEAATRRNLVALGLPLDAKIDTLLTKGERPEWGSDKTSRREFISSSHRVLLMVGDNLADFVEPPDTNRRGRREVALRHAALWGEKWFMVPNPLYGGWLAPTRKESGS